MIQLVPGKQILSAEIQPCAVEQIKGVTDLEIFQSKIRFVFEKEVTGLVIGVLLC